MAPLYSCVQRNSSQSSGTDSIVYEIGLHESNAFLLSNLYFTARPVDSVTPAISSTSYLDLLLVSLFGFIDGCLHIAQRAVPLFQLSFGNFPERVHPLTFGLEKVSVISFSLELLTQFVILALQLHMLNDFA